ncbi:hypothetical protein [Bdellovibrio bacteriovorus]|uniref:hypothetical protein n=1 Tax=Bdellovibrio TaxID=958 RepID=UPI0035A92EEB
MKNVILVLLFASLIHTSPALAIRNGTETNGGDGFVADFYKVLDETTQMLEAETLSESEFIQLNKIKGLRHLIEVLSTPTVFLNGREVSAINNPTLFPPRIVISQKYWKDFSDEQKRQLVLHEMLPVAGFYDKDYGLSSAFMLKLQPKSQDITLVYDMVAMCSTMSLGKLRISVLRKTKSLNHLIHSATMKGCRDFIKAAANAGWDIEYCRNGQTPYQALHGAAFDIPDGMFLKMATLDLLLSLGAQPQKLCPVFVNSR